MNFLIIIILILLIVIVVLKLISTIISVAYGSPSGETTHAIIQDILREINIRKTDTFVDLGSGLGNMLLAINKKNPDTKVIGYEISPWPYSISKIRTIGRKNISIKYRNILSADLTHANIVFCYLWPELIQKIVPKMLKELPKGAILISPVFQAKQLVPHQIIVSGKKKIYIYKF